MINTTEIIKQILEIESFNQTKKYPIYLELPYSSKLEIKLNKKTHLNLIVLDDLNANKRIDNYIEIKGSLVEKELTKAGFKFKTIKYLKASEQFSDKQKEILEEFNLQPHNTKMIDMIFISIKICSIFANKKSKKFDDKAKDFSKKLADIFKSIDNSMMIKYGVDYLNGKILFFNQFKAGYIGLLEDIQKKYNENKE